MYPSLQGSSPNLQGGSINLQPATGINTYQPAASGNILQAGGVPGNTGSINLPGATPAPLPTPPTPTNIGSSVPAPVYAPKLDVAALNAQARAGAEGAVNPLYTKYLNDFLANQGLKQQQQQAAYDTSVQNLKDSLANTISGNQITQDRAAQDAATQTGQINTNADQFQTDSGQAFDTARRGEAVKLANEGLTTSGLGQQQAEGSQIQHNTTEGRQVNTFNNQKQAVDLAKARTFEDVARSNELATQNETKGETAAKTDLNTWISQYGVGAGNSLNGAGYEVKNQAQQYEQQRLAEIAQETQNRSKLAYTQYLAHISNPAQLVAAQQQYGGLF